MARLTMHRRGQGLTPHRTWLLRARQSGPGSWLQLKGEEREVKGAANAIPAQGRSQPSSLSPTPSTRSRHRTPHPICPSSSPPATLPASSSGDGELLELSPPPPVCPQPMGFAELKVYQEQSGRVTCGVKGWSRPISCTVLHGVDFHKLLLEDRKQVGNPVVQPHVQDELAAAKKAAKLSVLFIPGVSLHPKPLSAPHRPIHMSHSPRSRPTGSNLQDLQDLQLGLHHHNVLVLNAPPSVHLLWGRPSTEAWRAEDGLFPAQHHGGHHLPNTLDRSPHVLPYRGSHSG